MDDGDKRLLKETLWLARDNNRMLHKMRRNAVIGGFLKVVWWVIILGGPVVLYYYYLQPYADKFFATYAGLQNGVDNLQNINTDALNNLKDTLNKFGL